MKQAHDVSESGWRAAARDAWNEVRAMPRWLVLACVAVVAAVTLPALGLFLVSTVMLTGRDAAMPTSMPSAEMMWHGMEEDEAWDEKAAGGERTRAAAPGSAAQGYAEAFADGFATPPEEPMEGLGGLGLVGAGRGGGGAGAGEGRLGGARGEPHVGGSSARRPSAPPPPPSPSPALTPSAGAMAPPTDPAPERLAEDRRRSQRREASTVTAALANEVWAGDDEDSMLWEEESVEIVAREAQAFGRGSTPEPTVDTRGRYDQDGRARPRPAPTGAVSDALARIGESDGVSERAQAFLASRERVEGLVFRSATGYWYNTYVPGDPRLRHLAQSVSQAGAGREMREAFERTIRRYDAPESGALALVVHGDRVGIEGETRMLVEVGLRASDRRGGYRGPMQVVVVLDLGDGARDAEVVEALLAGLAEAWDIGDRFGVVVAGRPGGVLDVPGPFAWGRAQVAARRFAQPEAGAERLDATAAWERAHALLQEGDADAGLGGTMIWWVTRNGASDALRTRMHLAAVDGVTTSVFGVGDAVSNEALEAIAVAGQGSRRRIVAADEAPRAVRDEITAAAQVVARAVRLRIRLSPGVRLVDVPGSYSLDEAAAQRVREAEQGVDRRVAAALGIRADRGEDEDGIQIVIPAFLAGDSHTILLDVVASRPGVIADVQVRFKDLVELRNGVLHGSWGVGTVPQTRGPLEWGPWSGLLAQHVASALEEAATRVRQGDVDGAARELRAESELVRALRAEVPGWGADRELERLERGLVWLAGRLTQRPHDPGHADGLELAARMQQGPLPAEMRGPGRQR